MDLTALECVGTGRTMATAFGVAPARHRIPEPLDDAYTAMLDRICA